MQHQDVEWVAQRRGREEREDEGGGRGEGGGGGGDYHSLVRMRATLLLDNLHKKLSQFGLSKSFE
jgi:hypothetical protein